MTFSIEWNNQLRLCATLVINYPENKIKQASNKYYKNKNKITRTGKITNLKLSYSVLFTKDCLTN